MQASFESNGEILEATLYGSSSVGVVLCPPHPLFGGNKNDTRIVRIARELASHRISALSFDYGSYGKGKTEAQNAVDALSFMRKKVHSLGLLGYSFGAVVASNAAVRTEVDGFVAISILKNVKGLKTNLSFDCPKLFIHGKLDSMAPYSEFEQIYEKATGRKEKLVLDTDHFYMRAYPSFIDLVSKHVCRFFGEIFLK